MLMMSQHSSDFLSGELNLDIADEFYDDSKDHLICETNNALGPAAAAPTRTKPKATPKRRNNSNSKTKAKAPKRRYNRKPKQQPNSSDIGEPKTKDVICARGRGFYKNEGNKIFTRVVKANLGRYRTAASRTEKSKVVASIVLTMQETGARFVRYDKKTNVWSELTRKRAHEKASHALRDHINAKPSASSRMAKSTSASSLSSSDSKDESVQSSQATSRPASASPVPSCSMKEQPAGAVSSPNATITEKPSAHMKQVASTSDSAAHQSPEKCKREPSDLEQYWGIIEPDPLAEDHCHHATSGASSIMDQKPAAFAQSVLNGISSQFLNNSSAHHSLHPHPSQAQFSSHAALASQGMNPLFSTSNKGNTNWILQQQQQAQLQQLMMLSGGNNVLSAIEIFNPLPLSQQNQADSAPSVPGRGETSGDIHQHSVSVDAGEFQKVYDILSSSDEDEP